MKRLSLPRHNRSPAITGAANRSPAITGADQPQSRHHRCRPTAVPPSPVPTNSSPAITGADQHTQSRRSTHALPPTAVTAITAVPHNRSPANEHICSTDHPCPALLAIERLAPSQPRSQFAGGRALISWALPTAIRPRITASDGQPPITTYKTWTDLSGNALSYYRLAYDHRFDSRSQRYKVKDPRSLRFLARRDPGAPNFYFTVPEEPPTVTPSPAPTNHAPVHWCSCKKWLSQPLLNYADSSGMAVSDYRAVQTVRILV